MSWKDDRTLQKRGSFEGFDILSRGGAYLDSEPELFVRGKATYAARLNPENPLGTIQSIEHVLRGLDRKAQEEQREIERQERLLPITGSSLAAPSSMRPVLKNFS